MHVFISLHYFTLSRAGTKQRLHARDKREDGREERKAGRREAGFDSKDLLINILSVSLVFINGLNILLSILPSLVLSAFPLFTYPGLSHSFSLTTLVIFISLPRTSHHSFA